MSKLLVLLALKAALVLLASASALGQRPAPISGDQAGSGPAVPPAPPVVSAPVAAASSSSPSSSSAAASSRPGCSLGGFHPVGDTWFTGGRDGCLKYTCQRDGVVSSQPCPRVLAPQGCSVQDGDADALYPACCPRRECKPEAAVPLPAVVVEAVSTTTTAAPPSSSSSSSTTTEAQTSTPSTTTASP
ncbi:transcription initiation factor TFIID subunit 4-like [Frankliniella occidentalis]|uniref:Transcription initiation factor TFIID subunit 4-like n=1 Tax=Frankliniella occidentalis TaxID=133901 RepID=A0A6J1STS6_FRAOC|nr:transcription initiation factor TFIID subunit 4-like [Frankliniella occidentalis]